MPKAVTSVQYYNGATPTAAAATSLKFNREDTKDGTAPVVRPATFVTTTGTLGTTPVTGSFGSYSAGVFGTLTNLSTSLTTDSLINGALLVVSATTGAGSIGLITGNTATTITVGSWLSGSAPTLTSGTGTFSIVRGTNFSWPKAIALSVDTVSSNPTTIINNRKIALDSNAAAPTGVALYWAARDSYSQATATLAAADNERTATVGATPTATSWTDWVALSTTFATYDSADAAGSTSGKNGKYVYLILGVSSSYTGGPNSAVTLPNIKIQYDER